MMNTNPLMCAVIHYIFIFSSKLHLRFNNSYALHHLHLYILTSGLFSKHLL